MSRVFSTKFPYENEVYFGSSSAPLPPSLDGIKNFAKSQLIIMTIVIVVVYIIVICVHIVIVIDNAHQVSYFHQHLEKII